MPKDQENFASAAQQATDAAGMEVRLEQVYRHNPLLVAARFALKNGLKVVVMPDSRAPVFAYQTWFKVGSRDEDPRRTGIAHLFEHLMFKGTAKHPTGELDREMERRGSQTNAATWVDWTYYLESLACRGNNLATVIDYESDRMTQLVLDEETFRSELEVVKNERRMSVEDSIVGALSERLFDLAYQRHPYRWPTIGSMDHLTAMTVEDLKLFYRSFYAPNNATVIVAGDVDVAEALTLLTRAYGPLSSQPVTRRPAVVEPRQTSGRQHTMKRTVAAPVVVIGYHAPAEHSPDYRVLEMLSDTLVTGDSARLYRRLGIDEAIATDVGGYVSPFAVPGLYELMISGRAGVDPQQLIDSVQRELDGLDQGLTSQELNKARNNIELGWIESLKDAESCAEALGHAETNHGDFSLAFTGLERYAGIGDGHLRRVAAEIFRAENRTSVVAVPH